MKQSGQLSLAIVDRCHEYLGTVDAATRSSRLWRRRVHQQPRAALAGG
jgi:hypothetical protein